MVRICLTIRFTVIFLRVVPLRRHRWVIFLCGRSILSFAIPVLVRVLSRRIRQLGKNLVAIRSLSCGRRTLIRLRRWRMSLPHRPACQKNRFVAFLLFRRLLRHVESRRRVALVLLKLRIKMNITLVMYITLIMSLSRWISLSQSAYKSRFKRRSLLLAFLFVRNTRFGIFVRIWCPTITMVLLFLFLVTFIVLSVLRVIRVTLLMVRTVTRIIVPLLSLTFRPVRGTRRRRRSRLSILSLSRRIAPLFRVLFGTLIVPMVCRCRDTRLVKILGIISLVSTFFLLFSNSLMIVRGTIAYRRTVTLFRW